MIKSMLFELPSKSYFCVCSGCKNKVGKATCQYYSSLTNDGTYFIIFHAVVFVGAMRTKRFCNLAVHSYKPDKRDTHPVWLECTLRHLERFKLAAANN